ncbi:hypothetical protein RHMOL_Rhmol05G0215900 [Rhododendron molle]|uniref:Uncharacterized protein n=1 Tax=Rhododendron molle TaxID=49168 RepID=A0ACC0NTN7_RHOML|nr:hypothetical protein RHMOL_Rhmol05G0215900 [Rhododendron molle]
MNRGHVLQQSSPVQQMMSGSPNWFNMISNMKPPPPTPPSVQQPSACLFPQNSFVFPQYMPPPAWQENHEDLPESWSQLLLGGMVGDQEDKPGLSPIIQAKKMENWEEQLVLHQEASNGGAAAEVKQENSSSSSYAYGHGNAVVDCEGGKPANWSQMMAASSPKSCVTSLSSNMLDFSNNKADGRHPRPDRSSECNSTATGGALKKARVQPSSTQSFKVRKEKLGDRITALHQLVSPFGKTDTASVLLEAIGYIRFLQSQVEALSLPYLGNGPGNTRPQHSIQGEKNCLFPEDPGQLVNDNCIKRKGASEQESGEEAKKDLRSRGLCLVPISCTMQVGSDNGADYWAPTFGGGFR